MTNKSQFDFVSDLRPDTLVSFTFPNIGVTFGRLDKEQYDILLEEVLRMRKEKPVPNLKGENLLGKATYEYDLMHMRDVIENKLLQAVSINEQRFAAMEDYDANINYSDIKINSLWVTYMKKHEYNGLHRHSGCMSFVIWMKIPYDLNEELGDYPDTIDGHASCFHFVYTNTLGRIQSMMLPVDKSYEGAFCIFPSKMMHFVNPFHTVEEDRIAISGNFYFDNEVPKRGQSNGHNN